MSSGVPHDGLASDGAGSFCQRYEPRYSGKARSGSWDYAGQAQAETGEFGLPIFFFLLEVWLWINFYVK